LSHITSTQNHLIHDLVTEKIIPDKSVCGFTKIRHQDGEVLGKPFDPIDLSFVYQRVILADLGVSSFIPYKATINESTESLPPAQQIWIWRYAIRPEFRGKGIMKAALKTLLYGWVDRYMGIAGVGAVSRRSRRSRMSRELMRF